MKKPIILLLILISLCSCRNPKEEGKKDLLVTAIRLRREVMEEKLYAIGTVSYLAKAAVTSKVMGEVERVYVDIGNVVRKGSLLIQLDTFPLQLELKKAKSELESAQAALLLSEAKLSESEKRVEQQIKVIEKAEADILEKETSLENLKKIVERKRQLIEAGAITQEEYDNILTELKSAETRVALARKEHDIQQNGYTDADLERAGFETDMDDKSRLAALKRINTAMDRAEVEMQKARIRNAQAGIESIQMLIDRSSVRAPISGIVASRNIEPGERVVNEEPLMVLMNIDEVYAVMNVTANDASKVTGGNKVEIIADAVADKTYSGVVTMVSPIVDMRTGVIEVKGRIPNNGYRLKPGMFIKGNILTGKKKESIRIPKSAIVTSQSNLAKVYVVINSNEVYLRDIMMSMGNTEYVEIESGLGENDVVLSDGNLSLTDGEKIEGIRYESLP